MKCPYLSYGEPAKQYGDYLCLSGDKGLLALQVPLSKQLGRVEAHDEMLFIITHQAYELWFKQILHELNACIADLKERLDDNAPRMHVMRMRLSRVVEILKLMNVQFGVLETMAPLDFLDFRGLFDGVTGFQSAQFRQIEGMLGLRPEDRFKPQEFDGTDYHIHENFYERHERSEVLSVENGLTLKEGIRWWLERTPFLDQKEAGWSEFNTAANTPPGKHPFWAEYERQYSESLSKDKYRDERLKEFKSKILDHGSGAMSPSALQAALFINLYRDHPALRFPFCLITVLLEIDEHLANFRHRHHQMVRRMIGLRAGTGGTNGAGYLEGAANTNYVFRELAEIPTFMIERSRLPALPADLQTKMSFRFAT